MLGKKTRIQEKQVRKRKRNYSAVNVFKKEIKNTNFSERQKKKRWVKKVSEQLVHT